MDAIFPDKNKSIKDGGLPHSAKSGKHTCISTTAQILRRKKISLDKPIKDLPEKAKYLYCMEMMKVYINDLDYYKAPLNVILRQISKA